MNKFEPGIKQLNKVINGWKDCINEWIYKWISLNQVLNKVINRWKDCINEWMNE